MNERKTEAPLMKTNTGTKYKCQTAWRQKNWTQQHRWWRKKNIESSLPQRYRRRRRRQRPQRWWLFATGAAPLKWAHVILHAYFNRATHQFRFSCCCFVLPLLPSAPDFRILCGWCLFLWFFFYCNVCSFQSAVATNYYYDEKDTMLMDLSSTNTHVHTHRERFTFCGYRFSLSSYRWFDRGQRGQTTTANWEKKKKKAEENKKTRVNKMRKSPDNVQRSNSS